MPPVSPEVIPPDNKTIQEEKMSKTLFTAALAFVLSIGGEAEVAKGWRIGGDAGFTRGRHDKDFSCSVTVKRMW